MSRLELLKTLNTLLRSDYVKVEQLKDGVAYCELFDLAYPNTLQLNNLIFLPKNEDECVRNLKVLDHGFRILKIAKDIPCL